MKLINFVSQEALEAIFDGQAPVQHSLVKQMNRIQGSGNDYTPEDSAPKPGAGGYMSNMMNSVSNAISGDGTDVAYNGHPGASGNFSPAAGSYGGGGGAGGEYNGNRG